MKHINIIIILVTLCCCVKAQKNVELLSPDGNIKLSVRLDDKIYYTVSNKNRVLFQDNILQLHLRNETLGTKPRLSAQKQESVNTEIKPVVPFKFATIRNHYNSLTLDFRGDYSVEFRAFDDGIAHRFITRKKGNIDVLHEDINLSFVDSCLLHVQLDGFASYYESPYLHIESHSFTSDTTAVLPILIDTRKGVKILMSEADLNDYPCLFFRGRGNDNGLTSILAPAPLETVADPNRRNIRVVKTADYIARTSGTRTFPWRWFVIADSDATIVESTMVCRLSPQNIIDDPSWIKPGLVMWDWLNRGIDYGPEVNYKAGVNTEAYRHYIDFASRNHIPYMLIDAGWSKDIAAPSEVKENLDLKELVRYGREKNVELILWITFRAIQDDFDDDSFNLFEHFSQMGIRGFKIDFMDRNDQQIVRFYERAAKEATKYRMLIELHGSYKPVGLEYRYPNLLSFEGVRGMEALGGCIPDNSLYLPFMRNVIGPMSFTPGSMLNVQPEHYRQGLGANLVMIGSRVHHIAYYIVFESGLQMISDSPRQFDQNADCRDFIFSMPVTWDETRCLFAEAGQYVIVARRKGDKWWIGGIANNAEKSRTFDVPLDFLTKGKTWQLTSFEDGKNVNQQAMDYDVSKHVVRHADSITITMGRNGGWAATIELFENR
jgi:alpha-glucosidase